MVRTLICLLIVSFVAAFTSAAPRAQDRPAGQAPGDDGQQRIDFCANELPGAETPRPPNPSAAARIAAAEKQGADSLDLSGLQLDEIPAKVFDLANLKRLDLSSNRLTALPAGLWRLGLLEELHVNGNQLTSLPAELGNLKRLTVLELNANRLTDFPAGVIGSADTFKVLRLANNQLSAFPAAIGAPPDRAAVSRACTRRRRAPSSFAPNLDTPRIVGRGRERGIEMLDRLLISRRLGYVQRARCTKRRA